MSKDAELAKMKRAIRILLAHLDNSLDFVTGHITNGTIDHENRALITNQLTDATEQRFSDEDELYVIRNKERIQLAYGRFHG